MNKITVLNHVINLSLKNVDECTFEGIAEYYQLLGQGIVYQYLNDLKELEKITETLSAILNNDFNNNIRPSYYQYNVFRGIKYGLGFLGIVCNARLQF